LQEIIFTKFSSQSFLCAPAAAPQNSFAAIAKEESSRTLHIYSHKIISGLKGAFISLLLKDFLILGSAALFCSSWLLSPQEEPVACQKACGEKRLVASLP